MSPLAYITRTVLIGAIWSVVYFGGMRSVMINTWKFDFIRYDHWKYIWNLWVNGWIIDEPMEWYFLGTLFVLIPLWLTFWTAICSVPWGAWFVLFVCSPYALFKKLTEKPKPPPLPKKFKKKKKKKKERPPAMRHKMTSDDDEDDDDEEDEENTDDDDDDFSDLMDDDAFDDDDDDDDDEDDDDYEPPPKKKKKKKAKSKPSKSSSSSGSDIDEVIEDAGYKIISDASIGGRQIDFVAVAEEKAIVCLVDAEEGDWLADEERFNDEEPLWFSESNHRISPVRQVLDAKEALEEALGDEDISVEAMVIVKLGTVINAEDMLDIWEDLSVSVSRIADGGPEELPKLADVIPDNSGEDVSDDAVETVEKAIEDS